MLFSTCINMIIYSCSQRFSGVFVNNSNPRSIQFSKLIQGAAKKTSVLHYVSSCELIRFIRQTGAGTSLCVKDEDCGATHTMVAIKSESTRIRYSNLAENRMFNSFSP